MVFGWILIGAFFILGVCLILFSGQIVSWWAEKHSQITKDWPDIFKPSGGYRFQIYIGAILFRIMGVVFVLFTLYVTYLLLFT
jgi:hypothetical protein